MSYPAVLTEDETLDAVLAGRSLARIGDGELKLALGRSIKAQRWSAELGGVMREVARGDGDCLVGIPNLFTHALAPERSGYVRFVGSPAAAALYGPGPFGSAFITRPDCAAHIDRAEYWAKVRSLWAGRDVVLVYGSGKGLTPRDLKAAASVECVFSAPVEAWRFAGQHFNRLRRESRRVLLCLGPTATALAWWLAGEGVHAVDLGGIGRFMRASRHASLL